MLSNEAKVIGAQTIMAFNGCGDWTITKPDLWIFVGTGDDRESQYTATIYPGPKGNLVINASTIFWAQGLSHPPGE